MEILLNRRYKGPEYTIGSLYIDGSYICDTLEDTDRGLKQSMTEAEVKKLKVYSKTAIPTGRYKVVFDYSSKFGNSSYAIEHKIPLIENVKGFTYIRIHAGNTDKDTEGCILLGENKVKGQVINSKAACKKVLEKLWLAWKADSPIYITIK